MRPLEDYLIIDFSQFLSGPSAALKLADLGARVIKIEKPGTGDICRHLYTSNLIMNGESSVFHAINRNKESFAADIKDEQDREKIIELVKQADVVMHNFRPGVMERLGFDYESVKKLNPSVVYGEISGYGNEGPWKDKPGQDLLLQSLSGLTWLSGNAGGPVPMGLSIIDMLAGNHLAQGILACLLRKTISGEGALVQVSMLESAFDFQFEAITTYYYDGKLPERSERNSAHAYLGAPYGIYQTANGFMALAMGSIPQLGELLSCDPLLSYTDLGKAFHLRDEIKGILAGHLATNTTEYWLAILQKADIWCAEVLSWDKLMKEEGFKVLDMIQEVAMNDGYAYQTTRSPIRIDGEILKATKGSPKLGEDNQNIINEFDQSEIMSTDTIRIAVRKFGPFETAMQKFWDAYCAQTGCTLQAEMIPMDLEELHKAILFDEGLKNGDWDIAHVVTDWLYEAYTTGSLENLSPYIKNPSPDDFPQGWSPSLLGMQQYGDQIVGLPFHDGPECLIYRKDLFEDETEQANFLKQHGKPLQVPQTWDDFRKVARFFHRPGQNLYGSVFAGLPDGHNTVFDFCLQLWSRGGELVDAEGKININNKAALDGLAFYRDILRDPKAIHPGTPLYESVQTGMALSRGEAAMMVNWFGFASMCEVIDESKVKGKVDIAPVPSTNGNQPVSLNVYWLYAIGSGSKHKEIAYDFLRFATSAANDKLLTTEGGIGCRISTWHDEEINQLIPYYHKLEELHQTAKTLPQHPHWADIAHVIDDVVLQAINTDKPLQQLLSDGQLQIEKYD